LQHNDDWDYDSQLEILIENGTQLIKTSRLIEIFDWDLAWDSDGLGAMRKDLIGARDFSKLDEIYDKVGFLRSLLQHGYFAKGVHDDEEIKAILKDTEYTTELCTTLANMDDVSTAVSSMLRLTYLEFQLSKEINYEKFQTKFKVKNINKNAENNYTATVFNEFIRGDLQITFQGDENGFSISSVDGLWVRKAKNSRTLYHCVYHDSAELRWKGGATFTFTDKVWFNHVYPQSSDMSKIKYGTFGHFVEFRGQKSAEFYVFKINSAVDIVYKYALKEFR
jgi:hypothetical protein